MKTYAAGSLRAPLTTLAAQFERETGQPIELTFGASGLLRDRIASGAPADVFASANLEHPHALVRRGWARAIEVLARNELCALVHPRVPANSANLLEVLLDPRWKVGIGTPKSDPAGDYAWEVFARAEVVKPGAFAALSAKAMPLTGGPQSPTPGDRSSVYAALVANGDADVFLTYYTNALQAIVEAPQLASVRLPAQLRVAAVYGLATRWNAPAAARAFARYIRSHQGRIQLAAFGFAPP